MGAANKSLIPFIHILRGVAPLLVVWAHLGGAWYAGTHKAVLPVFATFREWFSTPLRLTGDGAHLAVMVFFIISGFIISHVGQTGSRIDFILRRSVRILPTLFLTIFITWLIAVCSETLGITPFYGNKAQSAGDYIATALTYIFAIDYRRSALGPVWSLYVEFIFYGIFAIWMMVARPRPVLATIGMLASVAMILAPVIFSQYAADQATFTGYLPFFIIGRAMYLYQRSTLTLGGLVGFTTASIAMLFWVFEQTRPGYLTGDVPFEPIVTYIAAPIIFFAALKANIERVPAPLMFLGNISYALYLIHEPIGNFAMNALFDAGVELNIVVAAGIAASFITAAIVTLYFERPIQKLARNLRSRPKVPANLQSPQLPAS